MSKYTLAIHGGAGKILKKNITAEQGLLYKKGLEEALEAGFAVLDKKGSALDAVRIAVMTLEDNIFFNAGRGSVFTHEGLHEMDAAIMDGEKLRAGAVAGVRNIRNPIELAYEIMKNSNHVFLSGEGANAFAEEHGMKKEADEYFFSQSRYDQLMKIKNSDEAALDHNIQTEKKLGTVGAVARDMEGNLAAATSTGGLTNKKFGRIGDTPLIGCGTYADNASCGISCTGDGEFFIRTVAAHTVYSLIAYKGMSVQEACDYLINTTLKAIQGEGGLIALDRDGNIGQAYNSPNMHRGSIQTDGTWFTAVFE